ncbi:MULTISPECIES: GUN4 domain-containing protein [Cyanophyceae]|uniref:GUN4 domain-containing protein n=1 Tax=Cyanophyceae TaxID=3028117 RepID=UPI0016852E3B|nr:GUN4 domain-containing protein [Trichocoleus sp. FACHB-40]MBD2001733.1 GUN4 domain-containing protein [Trichocoleus sp. FACHB-40]
MRKSILAWLLLGVAATLLISVLPLIVSLNGKFPFSNSPPSVDLKSAVGADYAHLDKLLQQGLWKKADQHTFQKMLEVSRREREKWLSVQDIKNFPCKDLGTLDQLWEVRSQGRFGFSIQRQLWIDLGGGAYSAAAAAKFGDYVGWRQHGRWLPYAQLMFQTDAPIGHLPASTGGGVSGGVWGGIASLATQVSSCSLDTAPGKRLEHRESWEDTTWAKLETSLAKREWLAANWMTLKLMENISNQGKKHDVSGVDLDLSTFPCRELKKIDQLWLKYSEGRLGFSVQQKFYLQTGNKLGEFNQEKYDAFQEAIGWAYAGSRPEADNYDLRFPSVIPQGYFPNSLGYDRTTFGSGFFHQWRASLNPECNL